nr:uncharacterized protein TOR1AIP2 isoform X2 [Zootoca vivipara]
MTLQPPNMDDIPPNTLQNETEETIEEKPSESNRVLLKMEPSGPSGCNTRLSSGSFSISGSSEDTDVVNPLGERTACVTQVTRQYSLTEEENNLLNTTLEQKMSSEDQQSLHSLEHLEGIKEELDSDGNFQEIEKGGPPGCNIPVLPSSGTDSLSDSFAPEDVAGSSDERAECSTQVALQDSPMEEKNSSPKTIPQEKVSSQSQQREHSLDDPRDAKENLLDEERETVVQKPGGPGVERSLTEGHTGCKPEAEPWSEEASQQSARERPMEQHGNGQSTITASGNLRCQSAVDTEPLDIRELLLGMKSEINEKMDSLNEKFDKMGSKIEENLKMIEQNTKAIADLNKQQEEIQGESKEMEKITQDLTEKLNKQAEVVKKNTEDRRECKRNQERVKEELQRIKDMQESMWDALAMQELRQNDLTLRFRGLKENPNENVEAIIIKKLAEEDVSICVDKAFRTKSKQARSGKWPSDCLVFKKL